MERNNNELRVGLAVIAALIFLVISIMWAKGCSLRVRQYDIAVVFDNVQGLESGSNVLASGVVKGRVHDVQLLEGRVYVDASIDKDVKLYSDYRIIVDSPTLLAGKVLSIYPGQTPPYANTDSVLVGSTTLGMAEAVEIFQDMSGDLKVTIHNLNNVLVSMNEVVGDSSNQANIAGTLMYSSQTAKLSAEWLEENRVKLSQTLAGLEAMIARADEVFTMTGEKISTAAGSMDTTLMQIDAVTTSLRNILSNLEQDDNTAGKLLHDDELYIRLNTVLARLDSLAADVQGRGLKMRHTFKIF